MRQVALLLLGLPIACTSEAPHAQHAGNKAQPRVEAAPIAPAPKAEPADLSPNVPRGTSKPSKPAEASDAASYRAIGTEPFWAVTVRDDSLLLERPDHPPLRLSVQREESARATEYRSDGFTLTAVPGPCSDGMSDAIWSDRVQIAFWEGTLKGCGGIREQSE